MRRAPAHISLACLAAFYCGCVSNVDFYTGTGDAGSPTDLAGDSPRNVGDPVYFSLGVTSPERCAASLASAMFRQALCTCNILAPQGKLTTKTFDSGGQLVDFERSASVASNGAAALINDYAVLGALYVFGPLSAGPMAEGYVKQSLQMNGQLTVVAKTDVMGEGWVNGNVTNVTDPPDDGLQFHGLLHVPISAMVSPGVVNPDNLKKEENWQQMMPPCDCDTNRVSIANMMLLRARDNDNERNHFNNKSFSSDSEGRVTVSLPPGEYYLWGNVAIQAPTILEVHGSVAIYVDGRIDTFKWGSVDVKLMDEDASLDVVFTGELSVGYNLRFGDPKHPSRVRLWSSTKHSLVFANRVYLGVGATIYAPSAQLVAPGGIDLFGAALVREIVVNGGNTFDVHYDRAVLRVGNETCGTPATAPLP